MISHVNSSILLRVLSNLINNSVESIIETGVITVGTRTYESVNIISVIDNGSGMSEEMLKVLGNKGFSSGKEKGNGLGFYHAKKSIEEAGGSLEVRSRVGVGTMVEIKLPRANP